MISSAFLSDPREQLKQSFHMEVMLEAGRLAQSSLALSWLQITLCSMVKGDSGGPLVLTCLQDILSNAHTIESSSMNIIIVGT